ncbi:tRNA (5-methylaminomethyl-2-thiouridine)(34)-methyltransferase MnmD [Litorimonas sp. RW-G-Af-16]|uniref:tRNA (5-methylaminomethyl-2-thiouridine)(34)-methyltransferase MnmD n=1 Tax=Litorimonas sp. RW-G-Af-16 TaxID=3241168 RepID=UPI003AAB5C8D
MPAPTPLTQCDPPTLDWSRPGTPAAKDFGDIYFSTDGGLDEARIVFLQGCDLPNAWQNKRVFTVGELGFGSGLNFLATCQMWEATKPKGGRLHFVSIEKFPFDQEQLARALSAWPELSVFADQLINAWPGRVRGLHRLHFGDVTLTLIHDDIEAGLGAINGLVDAWFLDGFSPSRNPDMWSASVMQLIAQRSAAAARLATFTVAGAVRIALKDAGFTPQKMPGFGRKRERLEAVYQGPKNPTQHTEFHQPLIIGAGIAGASLARAFMRRGVLPRMISRGMETAASANAAALIKPRLDLQDRPESRFFLASYLYALQAYQDSGGIIAKGVTHLPKSDADRIRFEKLVTQAPLSPEHLDLAGGALLLGSSLVIDPDVIRHNWLNGIEIEEREVNSLSDLDHDGSIIVAAGFGVKELVSNTDLGLRYSRGQLTWAKGELASPVTYGGYALPLDNKLLLGATHGRLSDGDPYAPTVEDDKSNLENYRKHVGQDIQPVAIPSHTSVRVTTADTLPLLDELDHGTWLLSGLGSRGFVFAPLLAEALVSRICGESSPIDPQVWARFGRR